jgi:hypothetical protein
MLMPKIPRHKLETKSFPMLQPLEGLLLEWRSRFTGYQSMNITPYSQLESVLPVLKSAPNVEDETLPVKSKITPFLKQKGKNK